MTRIRWYTVLGAGLAILALVRPAMGEEKTVKSKLLDKSTTIKIVGLSDSDSNAAYKFKVGGKNIEVNAEDSRVGDVHVAKGDTVTEDLATKNGTITVDGFVEGDVAAMGGSVIVNGEVSGDVAAFGGKAVIPGKVNGSVAAFGGAVEVSGTVDNDIACFGGNVSLLPTAVVEGNVAVMGGQVDKADSAVVNGDIKNISLGMLNSFIPDAVNVVHHKTVLSRFITFLISLIWVAAIALLTLLVVLFFPRNVERIARAVELDIWKSVGIGLLVQIAILPAIVLMAVSILGIPLIPLGVLLLVAACILGFAGFGLLVVRRAYQGGHREAPATVAAAMLGFLMLNALLLLGHLINVLGSPFTILGWILIIVNFTVFWFATTVGLGAVWTTRLGSRDESAKLPAPAASASAQ